MRGFLVILVILVVLFACSYEKERSLRYAQVGELQEMVTHYHMDKQAAMGQLEDISFKDMKHRLFRDKDEMVYTDYGWTPRDNQ